VFVHRVPMLDSSQAQLLSMLSSALYESAAARNAILEFLDENGYWYVVTKAEKECLLLKPWLEAQVRATASSSSQPPTIPQDPARAPAPPPVHRNPPLEEPATAGAPDAVSRVETPRRASSSTSDPVSAPVGTPPSQPSGEYKIVVGSAAAAPSGSANPKPVSPSPPDRSTVLEPTSSILSGTAHPHLPPLPVRSRARESRNARLISLLTILGLLAIILIVVILYMGRR
jgi:cobalamin biosynthesis Mg chelatase CobN